MKRKLEEEDSPSAAAQVSFARTNARSAASNSVLRTMPDSASAHLNRGTALRRQATDDATALASLPESSSTHLQFDHVLNWLDHNSVSGSAARLEKELQPATQGEAELLNNVSNNANVEPPRPNKQTKTARKRALREKKAREAQEEREEELEDAWPEPGHWKLPYDMFAEWADRERRGINHVGGPDDNVEDGDPSYVWMKGDYQSSMWQWWINEPLFAQAMEQGRVRYRY